MIVDSAACELAVSYAPAMLEASHETPASLNYDSWPLFADCEGPEARVAALHRYNASLAPTCPRRSLPPIPSSTSRGLEVNRSGQGESL